MYEILKRVSIMDLCSITQTCSALCQVANKYFEHKHKICDFQSISVSETAAARRVFQTFGRFIVELKINLSSNSCYNPTGVMDAVIENCSLSSLSLEGYEVPDNQDKIIAMGLLFQKLKKLHIEEVSIECIGSNDGDGIQHGIITPKGNFMDLFTDCDSLTDLTVKECYDFERVIFLSKFPKLRNFECRGLDSTIECLYFALHHKNLRGLNLTSEYYDHINILKSVPNFKYLELLRFQLESRNSGDNDTSLKSLERLPYLRELKIHIVRKYIKNLIKILPKLSTLEVLELEYVDSSSDLMSVVTSAFFQIT